MTTSPVLQSLLSTFITYISSTTIIIIITPPILLAIHYILNNSILSQPVSSNIKKTDHDNHKQENEPPVISHPIPVIGHLWGLLRWGISYFDGISKRSNHEIFTVPLFNVNTYVIASPELVTACMRETKTLSFNPFIVEVFRRLAGLSDEDMAITKLNMDDKSVSSSYMTDMHRVQAAALAPGPALDAMNENVLSTMAGLLEDIPKMSVRNLWETTRRISTVAALRTIYGPRNPFDLDPTLLDDFWLFERDLKWILLSLCTSVVARKAYRARSRLIDAFRKYYAEGGHLQAALVVRERLDAALKHGQTWHAIAAFEVGLCFGILTNAVTTVFWMIAYIYHDSDLLTKIRDETAHLIQIDRDNETVTFNLHSDSHLRTSCPILTSTFHETLRHISASLSSGRYVLQDTILQPPKAGVNQRSYILKKGSLIQIPSQSLHFPSSQVLSSSSSSSTSSSSSPFQSQPDINEFNAYRFMKLNATQPERSMNGSFRAFGGGSTLCPGRKFAYMEIIGLVVMWIHLFDVTPASDGFMKNRNRNGDEKEFGVIQIPKMDVSKVAVAVAKPVGDVGVYVKRRDELVGLKVNVKVGEVGGGSGNGGMREV